MHRIGILAWHDVIAFEVTAPAETFRRTLLPSGDPAYDVLVASPTRQVTAGYLSLRCHHRLEDLDGVQTLVVPGRADLETPTPPAVLRAISDAASRGVRLASICVGAFSLAEAGLLDGRPATTHWAATSLMAERFPAVELEPDVLYVDDGEILTSAGAVAGIDLCLHLIRLDHGAAVAAETARRSVMPLVREGGQAQFITPPPSAPGRADLAKLLDWLDRHLDRPLTLGDMARQANMSTRTLARRFRDQLGTTPARWLIAARVRRAQQLLEATSEPIELIAREVGFVSPSNFRAHFTRIVGTNPRTYRQDFGTAVDDGRQ
jgi:transcriptional regulator GlxA family with amidase domain